MTACARYFGSDGTLCSTHNGRFLSDTSNRCERADTPDPRPVSPPTAWEQRLLDGIRDEVAAAVLEGDAQDCSSADCIADATYEIVRVALRDYLLVSEAELAAALLDEAVRDIAIHYEPERAAAAIFAALGAAQEKGEAGS